MRIPKYIMVHHTAVSYTKNPDQFVANNKYHQQKWNFKSSLGFFLGYNYEINAAGYRRQARADGEPTAACFQQSMNDGRCVHIGLDGNFDIEKPKPNQIYALRDLLRLLRRRYNLPAENIYFHSQFAPKTCPGNLIDLNFIRSIS